MTDREKKTLEFLRGYFAKSAVFAADPGAGRYRLEHSIRVANLCRKIAVAEGLDSEAAVIAGLLHDVAYGADVPEGYDWKDHGRDSARIARHFLRSLGLDGETVNDICYAIAIHVDDKADFAGRRTPFTETVGDADNIDRFGPYRIYEAVRDQLRMEERPFEERLAWLRSRLVHLEELRGMPCGTKTATELWQDRVDFQMRCFHRLMQQMEESELSEELEETK